MLSPSWGRGRCRSPFLAAAILAAVVAAAAAQNAIIEQPRATQTSQTGVLSEVDSGLVTQVASSNGSSDVDTSDTPLDAADDRSGAIRGCAPQLHVPLASAVSVPCRTLRGRLLCVCDIRHSLQSPISLMFLFGRELEENLSRRQVFETKVSAPSHSTFGHILLSHNLALAVWICAMPCHTCHGVQSDHVPEYCTQAVPYRFIGFLRCKDGTRCTGALISDRHVLTAGTVVCFKTSFFISSCSIAQVLAAHAALAPSPPTGDRHVLTKGCCYTWFTCYVGLYVRQRLVVCAPQQAFNS